eukprot:m.122629 g.122629  ORF g.122629 m.122629 type:complete len:639 (+) comp23344_c0_seq3:171-2087(+)
MKKKLQVKPFSFLDSQQVAALYSHITQRLLCWPKMNISSLPDELGQLDFLDRILVTDGSLKQLPESIGKLKLLVELDVSQNKLQSLPQTIGLNTKLERLILNNNQLKTLPASISSLVNLQVLDLSQNSLSTLPDTISQLRSLKTLNLDRCARLSELPDVWSSLTNLSELFLTQTRITLLPESLFLLPSLKTLEICFRITPSKLTLPDISTDPLSSPPGLSCFRAAQNQTTIIPESFSVLHSLSTLDLHQNALSVLPSLKNFTELSYLNVFNNKITQLPDSLAHLTNLKTLNAGYNRLTSLPSLADLPSLSELFLNGNNLEQIGIIPWRTLTKLEVKNNKLTTLPGLELGAPFLRELNVRDNEIKQLCFGDLPQLTKLVVGANKLTTLEAKLGEQMPQLQLLYTAGNQLRSLPASLGRLSGITRLFLGDLRHGNQLETLPADIGGLVCLQVLNASKNRLSCLPNTFANLQLLTHLYLGDNNFTIFPEVVVSLRLEALHMTNNNLQGIPKTIGRLAPTLTGLILDENPELTTLPLELGLLTKLNRVTFPFGAKEPLSLACCKELYNSGPWASELRRRRISAPLIKYFSKICPSFKERVAILLFVIRCRQMREDSLALPYMPTECLFEIFSFLRFSELSQQ